jgi:hypothetical protein
LYELFVKHKNNICDKINFVLIIKDRGYAMTNIIKFPTVERTEAASPRHVSMTLTRNIKGLTVSINLVKLTREELVEVLLPLPSQSKKDERLSLIKKYINQ